jgi:hypothetical protein
MDLIPPTAAWPGLGGMVSPTCCEMARVMPKPETGNGVRMGMVRGA